MGLINIIEGIVNTMTVPDTSPAQTPVFISGWKGWQNLAVDEVETDVIILDTPLVSDDIISKYGNNFDEAFSVSIAFFRKTQLDYTPASHQEVCEIMRNQREIFFNKLRSHEGIRSVESPRTQDIYNVFNVNLSGVLFTFKCTPFPTRPKC